MANGILIVDKPQDWTSFDVVAKLRRIYGTKKIGHTGTLDPMATGVLCVFLGGTTRFISHLPHKDKRYIAEVEFGIKTDTADITGTVTARCDYSPTPQQLSETLPHFLGKISQIPPAYSAIKVDGRPLYKSARKGIDVVVPPRSVDIHALDLIEYSNGIATLDIHCGEGTYIRTLAEDIAEKCGSLATLRSLRRTKSGAFSLDDAITLDDILQNPEPETLLRSVELGFLSLERVDVDELRFTRLSNGLTQNIQTVKGMTRLYHQSEFKGLISGDGETVKAVRMCQY